MSLLDNGPDTVTVTPRTAVAGRAGTTDWTLGTPQAVPGGRVQETDVQGGYRWIGRGPWPGGPHSLVTWDGRDFDQVGEPLTRRASAGVEHVEVTLRARSVEAR